MINNKCGDFRDLRWELKNNCKFCMLYLFIIIIIIIILIIYFFCV